MTRPTLDEYIHHLRLLFECYEKVNVSNPRRGHPYTYKEMSLIIFFVVMILRRIFRFKAQRRWLANHPEMLDVFGFKGVPHRTTLSRRFKSLYGYIRHFLAFLGKWAEGLDEGFKGKELFEDKSLFKAFGPVWHRKHQLAGVVPEGLRNLDKDATWSKSEYHGWVYGYGVHLTASVVGFPKGVMVETGSVPESRVIDEKAKEILSGEPVSLTADNSYCKLTRIREWARVGVALITPGLKLKEKNPKSAAYKRFIRRHENRVLLKERKTAIEPPFGLISQILGLDKNHKQLPMKGLPNVRTLLSLGAFILQFAMIVNSAWGLPLSEVSHLISVFT